MNYTIVNKGNDFRVHKVGCKDIVKDINIRNDHWDTEAEHAKDLIEKTRQLFYEEAGGTGEYGIADIDEGGNSYATECAEQAIVILNCAK